jgi:hypothetical protein
MDAESVACVLCEWWFMWVQLHILLTIDSHNLLVIICVQAYFALLCTLLLVGPTLTFGDNLLSYGYTPVVLCADCELM